MATRMRDTEARKRQILEQAAALFAEKGYHGVGVDEIAAACGVVRGTVLNYFGSKQGLYRAVLYGRGNPAGEYLKQVCEDPNRSALEALEVLTEITRQQFGKNLRDLGKELEDQELLQNFDVIRLPIYRDLRRDLEKIIVRGNQEGVFHVENPRMRAFSVMFAVFGISESLEEEDVMGTELQEVLQRLLLEDRRESR